MASSAATFSLLSLKSAKEELKELIRKSKQTDDIPAPRITIDVGAGTAIHKHCKTTQVDPRASTRLQSIQHRQHAEQTSSKSKVVENFNEATASSVKSSIIPKHVSTTIADIGSEVRITVIPPQIAQQELEDRLDRERDLRKVQKQERKLIKQVNRPPNEYIIKHQTEFVRRRERELGQLFRKEREIDKLDRAAALKAQRTRHAFGGTVIPTHRRIPTTVEARSKSSKQSRLTQWAGESTVATSSATIHSTRMTTVNALMLPSAAMSQQSLQGDVRRSQRQLDNYHKMVNPAYIKKYNKPAPKLPKLGLWKYLHTWDVSSHAKRDSMILKFLEHYTTLDPVDMDTCLSHGGSLIFTRFVVAMQLAYERRKPIWHYFQALGLFMKSLQCEQYVYEFSLMGGFATAFSCLKMDEMRIRDKANVLYFLHRTIDGPSGTRVKNFICRESTFLDAVVDSLTMCNNISVIHFAQLFLENMCISTKMDNLTTVANYVISLLPCDFNPRVQIMACEVLQLAVHQKGSIAAQCFEYVVDVLKTDYDPILVPVGELCISIMATPSADDLLNKLIDVVEPQNLGEESVDAEVAGGAAAAGLSSKLTEREPTGEVKPSGGGADAGGADIPEMLEMVRQRPSDEFDEDRESEMTLLEFQTISGLPREGSFFERPPVKSTLDPDVVRAEVQVGRTGGRLAAALNADMFYRQQYGSIFVLSFMLKNRQDFAEWMVQKGIIGNLLTAIGSSSYHRVQLSAVRLMLLLHDLTPDCAASLQFLLPAKVVAIILEKGVRCLEYITAVHCLILRRLGRLVKKYWQQWFDHVVLSSSVSETDARETSMISLEGTENEAEEEEIEPGKPDRTKKSQPQADDRKSRFYSGGSPLVERSIESVLVEINQYTQQLETLTETSFDHIITTVGLITPDPEYLRGAFQTVERASVARLTSKPAEQLTIGEMEILTNEKLDKFRKYLNRIETEREDEFEKYYATKFGDTETADMTGMEQAALLEAERAIGRLKYVATEAESEAEEGDEGEEARAASSTSVFSSGGNSFSSVGSSLSDLGIAESKTTIA